MEISESYPIAVAAISAIQAGKVEQLAQLVRDNPGLASTRIVRGGVGCDSPYSYPLLVAATDWPGHFPRVTESIAALVAAGADVNARASGANNEGPLHNAASSNDLAAIDALLDLGADIEAPGAVIAGGTPLDDAVAFAQWDAARRLVARGAETAVWHAAALGLMDRVRSYFEGEQVPARFPWGGARSKPVDVAFWCACHGGQLAAAEYLLARGASLNWVSPWDDRTPLDAARRQKADAAVAWLLARGAKSAREMG